MEPHSYHQHHQNPSQAAHEESSGTSSGGKSSFLCRQSTTRWIPTSDQIRILKDLYYNSGIRSPNAEQIQRISAKLRQYGKIEGKNVFYWFQNHKARERQKKRFTVDITTQRGGWKPEEPIYNNKYMSNVTYAGFSTASSATSPPSFLGFGQMGSIGCGASYMEKGLIRDYSLPGAIDGGNCNNMMSNSFNWSGTDHQLGSPAAFIPLLETEHKALLGGAKADIETLQLFPMHGHQHEGYHQEEENYGHGSSFCNMSSATNTITTTTTTATSSGGENYIHGWFLGEQPMPNINSGNCSSTTLELSLGSPASFSGAGQYRT